MKLFIRHGFTGWNASDMFNECDYSGFEDCTNHSMRISHKPQQSSMWLVTYSHAPTTKENITRKSLKALNCTHKSRLLLHITFKPDERYIFNITSFKCLSMLFWVKRFRNIQFAMSLVHKTGSIWPMTWIILAWGLL